MFCRARAGESAQVTPRKLRKRDSAQATLLKITLRQALRKRVYAIDSQVGPTQKEFNTVEVDYGVVNSTWKCVAASM